MGKNTSLAADNISSISSISKTYTRNAHYFIHARYVTNAEGICIHWPWKCKWAVTGAHPYYYAWYTPRGAYYTLKQAETALCYLSDWRKKFIVYTDIQIVRQEFIML